MSVATDVSAWIGIALTPCVRACAAVLSSASEPRGAKGNVCSFPGELEDDRLSDSLAASRDEYRSAPESQVHDARRSALDKVMFSHSIA